MGGGGRGGVGGKMEVYVLVCACVCVYLGFCVCWLEGVGVCVGEREREPVHENAFISLWVCKRERAVSFFLSLSHCLSIPMA